MYSDTFLTSISTGHDDLQIPCTAPIAKTYSETRQISPTCYVMRKSLILASCFILIFAFIATYAGIFFTAVYNDNLFVRTAWVANDWVTLVIVLPSLLSVLLARNTKAELLWLGLLSFLFYNYSFYLFGAVFNKLFLLYVSITSLSFFSMLGLVSDLNINYFKFNQKVLLWITAFLLLLSTMLCLIEIPACINYITTGKIPQLNILTNHPTNVVFALDLTFIVPAMIIASVLNFRKNEWGGVLSVMMLVKGFIYGCVLIAGTVSLAAKSEKDPLLPVWIFIAAGSLVGLFVIMKSLKIDQQNLRQP